MKCGISIIVPIYNAERYIDQCIQSIISELQETDELILINDGSKDNSEAICREYCQNNIRLVSNLNHGVSYTRNYGINVAVKEYVMFVDADDYLLPGWRINVENGISTNCDVIYFQTGNIKEISQKELLDSIICYPKTAKTIQYGSACWGKIFKHKFLVENGLYFEETLINGEDGLFSAAAARMSNNYKIINTESFYFYRTDNGLSATHSFNDKFFETNIRYAELMQKQLEDSQLFSEIEVQNRIDFIVLQGLFLLTTRISFLKTKEQKKQLFALYKDKFYQSFYRKYHLFSVPGVRINLNYLLAKSGSYNTAIRMIEVQNKLKKMIKGR